MSAHKSPDSTLRSALSAVAALICEYIRLILAESNPVTQYLRASSSVQLHRAVDRPFRRRHPLEQVHFGVRGLSLSGSAHAVPHGLLLSSGFWNRQGRRGEEHQHGL